MKLQTSFELDPTLVISPGRIKRYMWGVQVKINKEKNFQILNMNFL